jgi:hypothetical protein
LRIGWLSVTPFDHFLTEVEPPFDGGHGLLG